MSPAKRPFHVALAGVASGLALSPAPPGLAVAAATGIGIAVLLAARPTRAGRPEPARTAGARLGDRDAPGAVQLAVLAGALVLAGAALGDARLAALDAPLARVRDGHLDGLRLYLATRPRPSAFGASAEAQVAAGPLRGLRLLVRVPRWAPLPRGVQIGRELVVSGRIRRLSADSTDRGSAGDDPFDFAAHMRRRGVGAELLLDGARATGRRRGGAEGVLDAMRRRAEGAVAAGLPEAEAALARGMVLGQDEEIDESTRQDWRDAGLAHLLAVSGQNVMLLVALAVPLLALARAGPRARGVALLVLVALYVPLAGAGPSLQRAGVMGIAGIAAMTLSRPSSRWYALLLAAAATLALNPRVSADPGWQLSFVAVAGILAIGRPLAGVLAGAGSELLRHPPKPAALALVRGLADAVAITLAATIATAPIVQFHFGAVPVAGLLANLLALPAVAPAMWLGMVKAALGLLAGLLPPAGGVAALLGPVARPPLGYLEGLAERCADLPGGRVSLPLDSPLAVGLTYALIVIGLLGARAPSGGAAPHAAAGAPCPASPNGPPRGAGRGGPLAWPSRCSCSPRWASPPPPGSARPRRPGTSRSASSTSARATPR